MRRMSFALTTDAVLERRKTVTRRLGWAFAKVGDLYLAVDKLRTKSARKLGVIEVVDVRAESLWAICREEGDACAREGFPDLTPEQFVEMFAKSMNVRAKGSIGVHRIEFRYVDDAEVANV
jgi:hypothetical protein